MSGVDVLDRLGGLPFNVEVELGSLTMPIREILRLQEGAVVSTGRRSGTPFRLLAGGEEIAEVEFVVLGDSLSARIVNLVEHANSGAHGTD
jgi:flagellar motor switch protein FliN